jgi:hypothetical protein
MLEVYSLPTHFKCHDRRDNIRPKAQRDMGSACLLNETHTNNKERTKREVNEVLTGNYT